MATKQELWAIADKLRGNIYAGDYKNIVLGLIFLKYADIEFEVRYKELMLEEPDYANDVEEYEQDGIFYVPANARYKYIRNVADGELNNAIDTALLEIMKKNKTLNGVLDNCFTRLNPDPIRLKNVMDMIDAIMPTNQNITRGDYFGEIYMYFLGQFAKAEGSMGGEYFTPQSVVETLVRIVEPKKGSIYDPACGSGGMFVQSVELLLEAEGSRNDLVIYGQELNSSTWKLAKLNMAIHKMTSHLGSGGADTFTEDQHRTLKADYILANPPFNLRDWGRNIEDIRWKFGVPPEGNANYAWISHMMHHLSDTGTAAIVLANGSLSTATKEEYEIRKNLLIENKVQAIITLPAKLFLTTGIPVCIWILSNKKNTSDVLFIDGKDIEGRMEGRALRVLEQADISNLRDTYHNWVNNIGYEDLSGFCKSTSIKEIEDNDYTLTPGRYVGMTAKIDDGISYETKMSGLTEDLAKLFIESDSLEENIKEQLSKIGWEL